MKTATGRLTRIPIDDNVAPSWTDDIKAHHATYFTAELLQRTSDHPTGADAVWATDHLALMRMARALRQDHLAQMVYTVQLALGAALGVGVKLIAAALDAIGNWLSPLVASAAAHAADWDRARREEYLSQATDVYDLERRMREFERRYQRSLG
jgi:hypothetical protein